MFPSRSMARSNPVLVPIPFFDGSPDWIVSFLEHGSPKTFVPVALVGSLSPIVPIIHHGSLNALALIAVRWLARRFWIPRQLWLAQ